MLKGYMYVTPKHICFFAKMPDKEVSVKIRRRLQVESHR